MEVKNSKTIVLVIISLIIGFVVGRYIHDKETISYVYYPYYKTVAHLNLNDAWVNIEKDMDNDIAYYTVSDDMTDFTMPKKNDEIRFTDGDVGIIEEISPNGFNVKVDSYVAKHGMSGTPCFNSEGEVIGYVSAAIGTNHIYCIWR